VIVANHDSSSEAARSSAQDPAGYDRKKLSVRKVFCRIQDSSHTHEPLASITNCCHRKPLNHHGRTSVSAACTARARVQEDL
jgi:hypothetical protein